MVDAVVSFAVQRLGDFLIQQAVLLRGVRDEVTWLKDELKMMQCFLKDAAEKEDGDYRIREWISQVRDLAYDIEDVIDTFILRVERSNSNRGVLASVKNFSCISNEGVNLYNIRNEIEALRRRVVEISRRRGDYGITNISDTGEGMGGAIGNLRQLRRTTSYAHEEDVVGFEDVTDSLVDELLKEEPRRCVISIFGMGGLGKTTLARKLYHHYKVEGRFEYRGWVCVSQQYRVRDLLQRVRKSLKQFEKDELEMLENMNEEDLERHLHGVLEGRRYLVVIDDVWEETAWQSLRRAFPENNNGSRVIITTRSEIVAERSDERTYVHELRFLRLDESWELFYRKAFCNLNATGGDIGHYLPDLETLGREMVAKCGGLPLAIIVLGGLLSRKQPHEWRKVKEHIWRNLSNESIHIAPILTLSFNDLPIELKPCFLYLGLFPEDYLIRRVRLIQMWIAEGFITPTKEEALEEVAEDWLNELVGRSLIQVAQTNYWSRIMKCRVHDLLLDLAVRKAKELNFLHIYNNGNINSIAASSSNTASSQRKQSVHSLAIERYASIDNPNACLRTLSFFTDPSVLEPSSFEPLKSILTRFRLLRVLELFEIKFEGDSKGRKRLPDAVGELIHLRYLGLENTGIEELPPSIGNLQALQTLHAHSNILVRLPKRICQLKQLRHLTGSFGRLWGVKHLTELQTLDYVDPIDWMRINLKNLTNLRVLHIRSHLDGTGPKEFTMDQIANFGNLQSCRLEYDYSVCPPSFEPFSHCPQLIQLCINGGIGKIPEKMHEYLPNLICLELEDYGLIHDPMPSLEKLPNLLFLELKSSTCMKKLTITANGFCQLKDFQIIGFQKLQELEVEEGAMPKLTSFYLVDSGEPELPERWRCLPQIPRQLRLRLV